MLAHPLDRRLHGIERAEDVEIEKLAVMINRRVGDKARGTLARIVDQDINMSKVLIGSVVEVIHLSLIPDVGSDSQCLMTLLAEFLRHCIERLN